MTTETRPAVWLTRHDAAPLLEVRSPATGEWGLLQDAWVTSRYDPGDEGPCVEVHTDADAWTAALDEPTETRRRP